jgi:type VI secretion system protein ImpE
VFLFELLTFAGEYDRAEKQLDVLARGGPDNELAVLPYRAALQGERVREHMFVTGDTRPPPGPEGRCVQRQPFTTIETPIRVSVRMEMRAGGRYLWVPRASGVGDDPAAGGCVTCAGFRACADQRRFATWTLARSCCRHCRRPLAQRAELRLGRATDWEELPDGDFVVGQKVWHRWT